MAFAVTSTGVTIETEEEILVRLQALAQSTISPSLDVSKNSVVGRLLAIMAADTAENQEVAQAIYNASSELATGQSLDNRSALTGTSREAATFSTIADVTIDFTISTAVLAGDIQVSVVGNPTATFVNDADFTAPSTGDHSLTFTATATGAVQAPTNGLQLDVTISGVNSITSSVAADPGDVIESDADLRIRRRTELTAQGTGTVESIRADVLRVTDVEYTKVLANRTPYTVGTLPPHSFEVVVYAGDGDDIAQAIWDGAPSGIEIYGGTSGTATDDGGNSQTVEFTRPTETRVYVAITVTTNTDTYGGDAAVAEAIANFTNGSLEITLPSGSTLTGELGVGDDVIIAQLYNAVYTVSGVIDITSLAIDTSPAPVATANIVIDDRTIVAFAVGSAGIQSGDVGVTSS